MDDPTLFRVVLHLLVVFTEQLFAALVSSGGNRRLPLAALYNRDFVVWTGHFVYLLSVIGGWGGALPPHFEQKNLLTKVKYFLAGFLNYLTNLFLGMTKRLALCSSLYELADFMFY